MLPYTLVTWNTISLSCFLSCSKNAEHDRLTSFLVNMPRGKDLSGAERENMTWVLMVRASVTNCSSDLFEWEQWLKAAQHWKRTTSDSVLCDITKNSCCFFYCSCLNASEMGRCSNHLKMGTAVYLRLGGLVGIFNKVVMYLLCSYIVDGLLKSSPVLTQVSLPRSTVFNGDQWWFLQ